MGNSNIQINYVTSFNIDFNELQSVYNESGTIPTTVIVNRNKEKISEEENEELANKALEIVKLAKMN